jgi:hypothetical protein
MSDEKQTIETDAPKRVPRSYDSIRAGALALDLKDRVKLKDELLASIDSELDLLRGALESAEAIVGKSNGSV